jgi:hypothetical protein
MTGVTNDPNILTGIWNVGNTWFFTVVFTAGEETANSDVMYVERGTTSLHISGDPGGGVCIGGFSTGTTTSPKFESRVPAHFYAGVEGVTNYSTDEVKTGGTWIDGKPIYRTTFKIANGAAQTDVQLGRIADFAELVSMNGYTKNVDNVNIYPVNHYRSDTEYHRTRINTYGTVIVNSHSKFDAVVTVEYTKATD